MPGGLLQIAINSGKDNYLVSNPQISFFKSVYRKYTRFSIETIKETPNLTNLQEDIDTKLNIKIPRNGDLLKRAYLTFDLPDIYSGYCELSGGANTDLYKFKWIENIGYNIIKDVSFIIGDSTIDKLYGEYMYIENELIKTKEEKEIIDELIGNVKEIYEPENSMGQYNNNSINSSYIQHKYPNIVDGNQYERFTGTAIKIDEVSLGTTFPSILGRKIKVPLDFWFSKNSGSALPLISLQYHEVRIEMTLRKINDLYNILDALNTSASHDLRIKPSSSLEYTRIHNFLADTAYVNDTTAAVGSRSLKNFGINTEFEFDYIFLDEAERKRFALYEHEYLITQHHQKKTTTGIDTSNYDLDISGNHLIQYLAIIPKRDDMEKINKYNNYTNWLYSDIPPYSYDYTNSEMYYNIENSKHIFYSNDSGAAHTDYFNKDYFKKNIITNMKLKFNGMDRTKVYDNIYFEKQQPLDYFKNKPNDGIYIYSFSLDPKNEQPTGACDFSNLSSVELECNFNQAPLTTYYKLNVDVYLVNYNILKIASGMGALEFA